MEVLYNGILNNKMFFIPLEGSIERIGIDDDNEKNETGDMKPRIGKERES